MEYRILGRTGLKVSVLALGTVEMGTNYGIARYGIQKPPEPDEAVRVLQIAADKGINFFDTAPTYGESERLLGRALGTRKDCCFATKVTIPASGNITSQINSSLEASIKALNRDYVDVLQIHNATDATLTGEVIETLSGVKKAGKARFLGASVYGIENATAVIKAGKFDVLQVAYNILDQRMAGEIFPAARQTGIGVICRSVLLKGALTERARWLPDSLTGLRERAAKAMALAGGWESLPGMALRFCLSSPYIDTCLVGVTEQGELDAALTAAQDGRLGARELAAASSLALSDEKLLNPTYWQL